MSNKSKPTKEQHQSSSPKIETQDILPPQSLPEALVLVLTGDDIGQLKVLENYVQWVISGLKEPRPSKYDPKLKKLKKMLGVVE